jgi:hypothetical protein
VVQPDLAAACRSPHRLEEDPPQHRRRLGSQKAYINLHAIGADGRKGFKTAPSELVQPLGVLAEQAGRPGNRRSCRSSGGSVEFGQDYMAYTIARIFHVVVALVLDPCLAASPEVRPKITPRDVEQRPDDQPALRIDAGEAGRSSPPHQLQQKRLCLVVLRMPDGDAGRSCPGGRPPQEIVSKAAGGVFARQPVRACVSLDVESFHDDGQVKPPGKFAAERLIPPGRRPKLMIEMGQAGEGERVVLGKIEEKQREGNRVGAAGEADEQTRAWRAEGVPPEGFPDLLVEFGQGSRRKA